MEDLILTGPCLPSAREALEREFAVHELWSAADPAAFRERHAKTRFMAVATHGTVDGKLMDAFPGLEIVANFGVGVDKIDLSAARARGVRVTNTPDCLNDAMAELTLGLMIALCRRLVVTDRYVRDGSWKAKGDYTLTGELTGAKVGILGLGRIGKEIALRCQAFRMQVVYHGRREQGYVPYPYYADLTEMAKVCDWLVCVVPGDTGTGGLVSRAVLEALGPEGNFVNVGRGSAVDEAAMVELLASGGLGGAALDVFDDEPNVDPRLIGMDNVVLSPHQGSATHKTRWAMGDMMVRNLIAWRDGAPLVSPVV